MGANRVFYCYVLKYSARATGLPNSVRASLAELGAGNARREIPGGADRPETPRVDRDLQVHDTTQDLVRRALETAGILFVESDRGCRVMLLNEAPPATHRRAGRGRNCIHEWG